MADTVEENVSQSAPIAIPANVDNMDKPILGVEFNFGNDQSSVSMQEDTDLVKVAEDNGEQTMDDIPEKELSEEALRILELEKKKKRREEKRQKDEAMRKHFEQPAEPSEPDEKLEPKRKSEIELKSLLELDSETELETEMEMEMEKPKRRTTTESALSEIQSMLSTDEIGGQLSSSSDGEEKVRLSRSVSFKDLFFKNFYFPSMSDLTTDSGAEDDPQSLRTTLDQKRESASIRDDTIVDPLTGEELADRESEQPVEVPKPAEESSVEEEESSSSEISFDWPFELDDVVAPEAQKIAFADDADMDLLLEAQSFQHMVKAESTTKLELMRTARDTRQIVIDFVFKLIDQVVETAEYVDPLVTMCSKMDKQKLITHLHRLMNDFNFAKQYNTAVSNKMFEYYRRLGQMRSFDRLPPEVERVEFERQREALKNLDHLKQKAVETKRINNLLLASVTMDLTHTRNITLYSVESLEECIRETLIRKDMTILPRIVDLELRRMQNMRNEISDSRLWLITRHHTLGRLIERKRNFDQITEELTMDQFLNAQREVASLDTKVDERQHELKRMHDRCTKHVHQLAFIREKMSMLEENLYRRKNELSKKLQKQARLKDLVVKLKVQHARLKEQKLELQRKSGLLYKPALLEDFDKTVDIINVKKKSVKKLRRTIQDLEARIAMYEDMARNSLTPIDIPRKSLRTSKVT